MKWVEDTVEWLVPVESELEREATVVTIAVVVTVAMVECELERYYDMPSVDT